MKQLMLFSLAVLFATQVIAGSIPQREGWIIHDTRFAYGDLVKRLGAAVKANGLIVVTRAGPTKAAASRGIKIPGNTVIGVFNNDFAVRALELSTAAMIEAPIRFYVTENSDGSATLSYKTPTMVFTPYFDEGGDGLRALAAELDTRFAAIAEATVE